MQILKIFYSFSLVMCFGVFAHAACPAEGPKGFVLKEKKKEVSLFQSADQQMVVSIQCSKLDSKEVGVNEAGGLKVIQVDDKLSYFELSTAEVISRMYSKKSDQLIKVGLVTQRKNETQIEKVHLSLVEFLKKH